MIGFDSLSDYVFPKFWLKTLARFFFQFILYLSVLVFHKGGVRGGGGGGAASWWGPHFFAEGGGGGGGGGRVLRHGEFHIFLSELNWN